MKKNLTVLSLSLLVLAGLASCGSTPAASSVAASSSAASSAAASSVASSAAASSAVASSEAASSAAASSSSSAIAYTEYGTGTEISIWMSKKDSQAASDLVTAYNTANPTATIKLKVGIMEEGDVGNKYTSDPDAVPDIAHVPGDVVTKLIQNNNIAVFPKADITANIGTDIAASTLATGQDADANQYALPFSLNTYWLYYDKTVFTTPASIASLTAMKVAAAKANKKTMAFDMANGWFLQSLFMADGEGIFKDKGTSSTETYLKGEPALNVAKYIASLYQDSTSYELGGDADMKAAVETNKTCASFVSGSWNYAMAETGFGGAANVGMAALPNISLGGEDTAWQSVGDYKSVVVSNNSKNKALAQKFAYFLVSKNGQKIRWEDNEGSTMPTSAALAADADFVAANKFASVPVFTGERGTFVQNTSTKFGNWWNAGTAFANAVKAKPTATDDELKTMLSTLETALLA